MASKAAVAGVLAYLHELYPTREIGAATAEAWAMTFADWDDATIEACARLAAAEPGRTFFPTPGELVAHRPRPTIDTARLLRLVERLSVYVPASGMIAPNVETVRAQLGADVADAYAAAGGALVFSANETSRNIASREFHKALEAMPSPTLPLALSAGASTPRMLPPGRRALAGPESLASVLARTLPAEVPA
jgi:hypothetical protein